MKLVGNVIKAHRVIKSVALGLRAGLRENPPIYLDVGARRGLPKRWFYAYRSGLIRPIFVEPDVAEADRLSKVYPNAVVLPAALGAEDGKRVALHVTKAPGCSSILTPDMAEAIVGANPDFDVIKIINLALSRLDSIWDPSKGKIDFIKLDIQGYELEALRGCGNLLNEFVCVEVETVFKRLYVGQPCFQEIFDFLSDNGFGLVKITPTRLFAPGEIVECDSFFVRHDVHNHPKVAMWKRINGVGNDRRLNTWGY